MKTSTAYTTTHTHTHMTNSKVVTSLKKRIEIIVEGNSLPLAKLVDKIDDLLKKTHGIKVIEFWA